MKSVIRLNIAYRSIDYMTLEIKFFLKILEKRFAEVDVQKVSEVIAK